VAKKPKDVDPKSLESRLYNQVSLLLDDLEAQSIEITVPQRLNALIAVGRILTIFAGLRAKQAKLDDPARAGSVVREYSAAFAVSDAARRRTADSGSAADEADELVAELDAADDAAA
jgi:hypothetical protein